MALSPLITDLPIIAVSLWIVDQAASLQLFLAVISVVGGLYLLRIGWQSMRIQPVVLDITPRLPHSLRQGVLINGTSPNPYLFWFTIGAPILLEALHQSTTHAGLFLAGFYLMLIGGKMVIALITGRVRSFLTGASYLWTMRLLGLLLAGYGLHLLDQGVTRFLGM